MDGEVRVAEVNQITSRRLYNGQILKRKKLEWVVLRMLSPIEARLKAEINFPHLPIYPSIIVKAREFGWSK